MMQSVSIQVIEKDNVLLALCELCGKSFQSSRTASSLKSS